MKITIETPQFFQGQGRREYQEDSYKISESGRYFIVCDGLGDTSTATSPLKPFAMRLLYILIINRLKIILLRKNILTKPLCLRTANLIEKILTRHRLKIWLRL